MPFTHSGAVGNVLLAVEVFFESETCENTTNV
jgi:hypothetical protein